MNRAGLRKKNLSGSLKENSLLELVGILSPKEADELESHIKDTRKRFRKQLDETATELMQTR